MDHNLLAVDALSIVERIDLTTVVQMDLVPLFTLDRGTITVLSLISLISLLGLSAFFSSSETALFSLVPHRVEALAREEDAGQVLQRLREDPHRLLMAILAGDTLITIAIASITTGLLGLYISGSMAVIVAILAVTAIVLLFGEIVPRAYAVGHTERWSIRVAKPLKRAESVLWAFVVAFDFFARQISRATGGRMDIETAYVTRQKIEDIIETGGNGSEGTGENRNGSVLNREEREILKRTLRFNETIAKEAMTPRLDMTAIPKTDSVEEAIQSCIQSGHARMPVYDGEIDNIIGVVHIRDLVRDLNYGESETLKLDDLINPVLHVPESKNVDELLREMRESRMHMVIVIDEFGTTEGLITIEDVVEEIVGEILDDSEEEPIEFVDEDTVLVRGEVNIDDVNDALGIELPEGEEFETIAGFIFNRAGRLVEPGETITDDEITIHIEQVDDTRIVKARIVRNSESNDAETIDVEPEETSA
jgi:putative hemolysin